MLHETIVLLTRSMHSRNLNLKVENFKQNKNLHGDNQKFHLPKVYTIQIYPHACTSSARCC